MIGRLWRWLNSPPQMKVTCHICEVDFSGPADSIHLVVRDHIESPEHRLAEWKGALDES